MVTEGGFLTAALALEQQPRQEGVGAPASSARGGHGAVGRQAGRAFRECPRLRRVQLAGGQGLYSTRGNTPSWVGGVREGLGFREAPLWPSARAKGPPAASASPSPALLN